MERSRLTIPKEIISMKRIYKVYILKLLSESKKVYGLEIRDKIEEHFKDNCFKSSHTTIYASLHQLEEEGYVTSTWDSETSIMNRGKRLYRITDEGLRYYKIIEKETVEALLKNKNIIEKLIELFI